MTTTKKKYVRFVIASIFLASAFLFSVKFGDKGLQFNLRASSGAAKGDKKPYQLSALRILNRVLLKLNDSYVEPGRIDPPKMLLSALEQIQDAVPEVVIKYTRSRDPKAAPKIVTVEVSESERSFDIGSIASLWEMSFKLKEIVKFLEENMAKDAELKLQNIEYAAINGMLETLDPHSTLLPPRNYEEMQAQTGGQFGGLGITIALREGKLTVISPIDGTPAQRAGIKALDHIVRIGDESTVNMSLNEAVGMLRGKPGTKATLWISRSGWSEPRKYEVERAIIAIESVDSEPLANKVGYLRIKNFQANTFADTRKHLEKLKEKMGGIQGLVLDLRDNPGGLLDQSIKISDLFLSEGTIVSTVAQGNKLRERKLANAHGTEPKYPIVVLVNQGSASASEIVSGALQNNNRAIVLGTTSFGKGSVQILYEFPDASALKLTVAQYLTPGGISIQGQGIAPDLRALPVTVGTTEIDMFQSTNVLREGDLDTALKNDAIRKGKGEPTPFVRFLQEPPPKDADPEKFRQDFEIKLAQRLLVASKGTWERAKMMSATKGALAKVKRKEMSVITRELKKQAIDWTQGPTPQDPKLELELTTDAAAGAVQAGSTVTVTAKVRNTGTSPVYQLKAITGSDNAAFGDREFLFGKVGPGEERSWSQKIKIPKDAAARTDMVSFKISDATKVLRDADRMPVQINAQARPHFAFSYEVEDANKDGLLQVGEDIKLKVLVKNNGAADSKGTLVYLKNKSRDSIYLKRGRTKIESLKAGTLERAEFTFQVKKPPHGTRTSFKLQLDVYDPEFREFTQSDLFLPYETAASGKYQEKKGHVIAKANATVHVGASKRAAEVARVSKGATLELVGASGPWFEVNLGERRGWILGSAVDAKEGAQAATAGATLQRFEAPRVEVKPEAQLTDKDHVLVTGLLKDTSKIKDYYIVVYNRQDAKLNTRKTRFHRVGAMEYKLSEKVPLFKGMNRVAIHVRDGGGMSNVESVYVYRK